MTSGAAFLLAVAAELAHLSQGGDAWLRAGFGGVRGMSIGPIENGYHPGVGYGSTAYARTLDEVRALGATWVALTPFGRVANLAPTGVDPTFEAPFEENRRDIGRAIDMAHRRGLCVLLVPHLWVETGQWRGELEPGGDAAWTRFSESYRRFVLAWAQVAEATHAEMLSLGVELRSWVTTTRAPSFARVVHDVRGAYHGLITYSANWDDVDQTAFIGELDVIGVNAFYPLANDKNASPETLLAGAKKVKEHVHALAEAWGKPVLFTETGYTTRPDPAVRPWEWPDTMHGVVVDEAAQAAAYRALLAPLLDEPDFAGFFVWRVYSDPDDTSQEAPWGFSPRGKQAEGVVRDAFAARWASDPLYERTRPARFGPP